MQADKGWSPYLAGGLSGLVSVFSVWATGKYLGASTSFVRSSGMLESIFGPERVSRMEYFIKEAPVIDWQWMMVLGIMVGAFLAAVSSGSFKLQLVPHMWQSSFGPSPIRRGLIAFIGGVIAMFGARLADGCPSGHGLSGSLQLAVSGYIALICFFVGGVITAHLLYGGGRKL